MYVGELLDIDDRIDMEFLEYKACCQGPDIDIRAVSITDPLMSKILHQSEFPYDGCI